MIVSKIQAAYQILKKAKKPMHIEEIIQVALDKKMIKTKGLTPASTLSSDMYSEGKRRERKGLRPRFVRVSPGKWALSQDS